MKGVHVRIDCPLCGPSSRNCKHAVAAQSFIEMTRTLGGAGVAPNEIHVSLLMAAWGFYRVNNEPEFLTFLELLNEIIVSDFKNNSCDPKQFAKSFLASLGPNLRSDAESGLQILETIAKGVES